MAIESHYRVDPEDIKHYDGQDVVEYEGGWPRSVFPDWKTWALPLQTLPTSCRPKKLAQLEIAM